MPTARNGRKSRSGLTPAALNAVTSRSPARRPPTSSTGDEQRHRQREGQERGQHEHQERHHEVERHALGDDEVGELVDAVDDEEEREDADRR